MSSKNKSSDREYGFLLGVYEYLADAESEYKVATRFEMVPTTGKGRFGVRMVAEVWSMDKPTRIVAQVVKTHPTAANQTLAGLMMEMAVLLSRMVGEWAEGEAEAINSTP